MADGEATARTVARHPLEWDYDRFVAALKNKGMHSYAEDRLAGWVQLLSHNAMDPRQFGVWVSRDGQAVIEARGSRGIDLQDEVTRAVLRYVLDNLPEVNR